MSICPYLSECQALESAPEQDHVTPHDTCKLHVPRRPLFGSLPALGNVSIPFLPF